MFIQFQEYPTLYFKKLVINKTRVQVIQNQFLGLKIILFSTLRFVLLQTIQAQQLKASSKYYLQKSYKNQESIKNIMIRIIFLQSGFKGVNTLGSENNIQL
ncbi:hypothetical protein TTHERM_000196499 (macronuclear) [Tetrahymena thermophila SB210]|uniref:Uncharacterized protein n=1 Tax=Tetrahymena thermophila (strain SB210) TaxID=312017 RepID=W7XC73_TETTS|nr:hypothetical protein TTHERM_000196499 [Tetrahymena thermophila SB210]EWS74118.1 hypothetical protein TTHERM_000196499 [Tetrahymena thermophila SB210]|eukprot:XP_012653373.1 hypothetical protein TTHERM_000196499 [Tetrahymena thermophila SB210]